MRPTIVCLCGSTRFGEAFRKASLAETVAGKIVLSIGCDTKDDAALFASLPAEEQASVKAALDELHLRKIDLADEVLILDCPRPRCRACVKWYDWEDTGGVFAWLPTCDCGSLAEGVPYVGESTRREIAYALAHGKRVRYLSEEAT